jgi:hypothetical protein
MQPEVQKSSRTTLPRSSRSANGPRVFSHAVAPRSSGA